MKTIRPKIPSRLCGFYFCVLVFLPILLFLFGWMDFEYSQVRRNYQTISSRNYQNQSISPKISHTLPMTLAPISECREKGNLSDIPQNIPAVHQLFLRYKHCRTFPRVLSPKACNQDLYLLLAIKSTAAQIDRRAALRSTWGQEGTVKGKKVKLVFLLGRSPDNVNGYPLQRLLQYESSRFGDILQWDFMDSFFNLTLKEIHFLSWFSHECHTAQFVLKGDDDVFVHTGNLLEFLQDKSPSEYLFAGDIIANARPIRKQDKKYFIPEEMFPGNKYPPYAGGGGYLMSRWTVIGLDRVAQNIELFPIDDVFVGMCLERMNVQLIFHDGFRTVGYRQLITPFNPCIYKDLMLMHKLNPVEMWTMWSLVSDPNLICSRKSTQL